MRASDIEVIVPLERQLFAGDPPWTAHQFQNELAGVPATRWYIVAVPSSDGASENTVVAGYAGLAMVGDVADIQTLAVAPMHQLRGLGATLLQALIKEAKQRGARELLLEVRADNTAALALYARHGFERIALRRGYYGVGTVDGLVLRRRLARGEP